VATTPDMDPPGKLFDYVGDALREADIRFAQVERLYSERGTFQQQGAARHARQHPRLATAFLTIPFDVVGVGSNHTGDWGPEAVEDTIDTFRQLGIPTVGAGHNISEARKEVIITRNGLRIAYLGYVSVLLSEYWATKERAGATPMRVKTYYESFEYQPGSPARVVTIPYAQDLALLQEDVRRAKQSADFVVVSLHWGVHFIPKPLADYQRVVALAAVDAGASVIFGHHTHVVQAVEKYKDAIIFYGLGNFSFYRFPGKVNYIGWGHEYTHQDAYSKDLGPGHTYHCYRYWNEGGIACVELDKSGIRKATWISTVANAKGQPEIVQPGTPKFDELRAYLAWASEGVPGALSDISVDGNRFLLYQRTTRS
jgi:poly-gamma-glutamate capsule biosynthesis protein CapA/YwtB (metallophosphatase superfamily)